ncbi:MAG: hypothetical protein H0T79_00835, partial [Deltaproteobacteria bacterium]|nr:hypothetical protein [Deltaproteobacteria bacterium]
ATSRADSSVVVTLNAQGEQLARELGVSIPELIESAKLKIDELYKLSRLGDLLRAFADTSAVAQRGLGVDYDPDSGDILIGASAGGIHGDVAIGTTNELLGGSIVNFAVMTGVNLGRWRHPRWTVFANGFYESTTIHDLDGTLLTLGAHVQHLLVPPTHPARVRWIGLSATTGLEYASWSVGTATGGSIESHFTAQGVNDHKTIHMSSTGTLDVNTTTLTVPLELTTGVRFFDTLVLYGGGGLDLTAGTSTIVAQLDSALTINADRLPVGTAVITGSDSNSPSAISVHGLLGFGLHLRRVRVALQGVVAPGELAVNLGLRIAL